MVDFSAMQSAYLERLAILRASEAWKRGDAYDRASMQNELEAEEYGQRVGLLKADAQAQHPEEPLTDGEKVKIAMEVRMSFGLPAPKADIPPNDGEGFGHYYLRYWIQEGELAAVDATGALFQLFDSSGKSLLNPNQSDGKTLGDLAKAFLDALIHALYVLGILALVTVLFFLLAVHLLGKVGL